MTREEKIAVVSNHCKRTYCVNCKIKYTCTDNVLWRENGHIENTEAVYKAFVDVYDPSGTIEAIYTTKPEKPLYDAVEKPQHYTSTSVECIDAMRETQGDEAVKAFCICNAFKYLWRHNSKNGDEDIKKASWYLNKAVELMGENK